VKWRGPWKIKPGTWSIQKEKYIFVPNIFHKKGKKVLFIMTDKNGGKTRVKKGGVGHNPPPKVIPPAPSPPPKQPKK
jgi:hypothetical protein